MNLAMPMHMADRGCDVGSEPEKANDTERFAKHLLEWRARVGNTWTNMGLPRRPTILRFMTAWRISPPSRGGTMNSLNELGIADDSDLRDVA
ncbi:hypothetical protein [Paraburkholderia solitsugae]|uniref:hypothetical protein n=1 Tax=Paraburkholderia solitsugae TaxID=2675748 RepID=UPI001556E5C2|nr:hypothetical protein [Paraburkholderia solitsugae]